MEEAEALCEDIALITGGRVVARGSADDLKERFGVRTLEDVYLRTVARSLGREAAQV
jgi:ABC-2 type transport system ATP-binding protein